MIVGIACNGLFLLWISRRQPLLNLTAASGVCAVLLIPHVLWMIEHVFSPFAYAAKWVGAQFPWWQRPADTGGFLLDQAMRVAPLAAWLVLLLLLPAGRAAAGPAEKVTDGYELAGPFLAIHAWGPLALMCSLSILFGSNLEMHWGTAFIWLVPIWFLRTRAGLRLAAVPLRTLFAAITLLQVVMLASYR